jgi:hypothetical protein
MFAHVSPESGSTSETVSTLNFAARVKQVELGKASQNKGSLAEMKELVRKPVSILGALICWLKVRLGFGDELELSDFATREPGRDERAGEKAGF